MRSMRHLDTDGARGQRVVAHRAHLAAQRGVHDEQPNASVTANTMSST
jgi:hypothetical protein